MNENTLKFKTRGTSNPEKKPKVYFCCHTDDFEKYFADITDDILKFHNCSVWYMESISLDNSTMFDLSQMQLFVVPVTYRFLTDDTNPAIEIFQYALRQNIPILPIKVEVDLEYFYARRFGTVQFLDRINNDPTIIPYSEKLSKYLSQVLIADDMAEKIRNAFHAYIFLSYRKKDREFAQRIMKKIHENEFYERVAIWYDEFLVPGEKFNEEIRKALEKSKLFFMVITPNIVNENNYVMNVEYPMAQKLSKPILPIEIVPVDKTILQKRYLNIPKPVDFLDDLSLNDRLRNILPEAADSTVNNVNCDYLIGLAYLSGIDVELDRGKGVVLIEKAAETGLEEAIRKLVDIYSKGIGSTQDFEKAYEWEERLIEKYQTIAEKSGKDKDIMVYLRELMNFIYLLDDRGDAEKALPVCEEAYEASMGICFGKGKTITKIIRIIFKRKWNDEYFDEAVYYVLKSSRFALKFSYDMDVREIVEKWLNIVMGLTKYYEQVYDGELALKELFATYDEFADIALKNEKYDKAGIFIEKMSVILSDIFDTEDSVDFKYYYALVYQKRGQLNQVTGNLAQSHINQQKYIDLLLEIADEYPEDMAIVTRLIGAQNRAGALYCREQDVENAEKWLSAVQKEIENLKERGYEFERGPIYVQTMILSGDIFFLKNDNENALDAYIIADEILDTLTENTMLAQVYRDKAAVLLQMGCCYERLGRYDEAAKQYNASLEYYSSVFSFSRSITDAQFQADVCEHLWKNAIKIGDYVLEREWYEKLLYLCTEIDKGRGNEYDKIKLNDLKSTRERLKKEGKIGNIDWKNPSYLVNYILKNPIEYDEKVQQYIEMEIGQLVDKYWQVKHRYMDNRTTMAFTRLTLILTRSGEYSDKAKEDELRGEKLHYQGIVSNFLLEHSNAFNKYDECAVLIQNFCGYSAIDCSKHMLGGKKQGMKDYWNYYGDEPFWVMPVEKIKYLDLWRSMHSWIMATKHKYL